MAEENEKCPSWEPRNIQLGSSAEIVLDCAVPVKEGTFTGKYGKKNWHLWFGMVENQKVWWRDDKKEEEGYTGKVIFFPTDKLNDELIEMCNGTSGVKVKISKLAEEGYKGKLVTRYKPEKLEGGTTLARDEMNFVEDVKNIKKDGVDIDEASALQMAKNDYKVSEERAKELLKMV